MSNERCGLCDEVSVLKQSHIIPAFIFKDLKDASATGYLRFAPNPNKRVQDGVKLPLLCNNCEILLNKYETEFANKIFHPLNKNPNAYIKYEKWMLKFCVSISWRILAYFKTIENAFEGYSKDELKLVNIAAEKWASFLLGHSNSPGKHEQHLIQWVPFRHLPSQDTPSNINRYIFLSIDVDVMRSNTAIITYAKLGKFNILGLIEELRPNRWNGSKIHLNKGVVKPRKYILPNEFLDFFINKASRSAKIIGSISPAQTDKISSKILQNSDRASQSQTLVATQLDIELFGRKAFDAYK